MTARNRLLGLAGLGTLSLLAGCASSAPQVRNPPPAPAPGEVVEGSGTDTQRSGIKSQDDQIYNAEHAMDSGTTPVSNAPEQGIP